MGEVGRGGTPGGGPGRERGGGPAGGPAAGPADGVAASDDDTTRVTYRYLRVSVVGLALLLTTSIALEILRRGGEELGSISAYYYSPARSVLVGSLVAIGPALIAIKGRQGWEDVGLDIAGMVIPIVALVPASRDLGAAECGVGRDRCIPPELVPAVQNNVVSLLVLGVAGLVFAWWSAGSRRDRPTTTALAVATGVWLVTALWFGLARASFLGGAHYAAAVVFFGLIAGVAFLNGRLAPQRHHVPLIAPRRYGQAYAVVGSLMVMTILVAVVLLAASALLGLRLVPSTIFVVEAILMALFIAFWTVQTVENWNREAAVEARAQLRRPGPG